MKKFVSLLLAVLMTAALFTGCAKQPQAPDQPAQWLTGDWKEEYIKMELFLMTMDIIVPLLCDHMNISEKGYVKFMR